MMMTTKLESFTYHLRSRVQANAENLVRERERLAAVSNTELESHLSWNTEKLMELSTMNSLLQTSAAVLARQILGELTDGALSEEAESLVVDRTRAMIGQFCMELILRGVDSSTSRAHNMANIVNIECARKVMERIAGFGSYTWTADTFLGILKVEEERHAVAQAEIDAKPDSIIVKKENGSFVMHLADRKLRTINVVYNNALTRKSEAKRAAKSYAATVGVRESNISFV